MATKLLKFANGITLHHFVARNHLIAQSVMLGFVDQIPEPVNRAVFLLRQNDNLPYGEIARLRCSPIGTVKTQMRRALARLRQALRRPS